MGVLALLEGLAEALTQTQVSLAGGTIQELPDLEETGARLGRSGPGRLLEGFEQGNTNVTL